MLFLQQNQYLVGLKQLPLDAAVVVATFSGLKWLNFQLLRLMIVISPNAVPSSVCTIASFCSNSSGFNFVLPASLIPTSKVFADVPKIFIEL